MSTSMHILRSPHARSPRVREQVPQSAEARGRSDFDAVVQCFEQTLVRDVHLFQANSASQAGIVAGFLIAILRFLHSNSRVMWVSQSTASIDGGVVYGPGLREIGFSPERMLFVEASRSCDVLWALEEGLRSKAIGAVVGEFALATNALDLTTTRRLALRSGKAGIPAYLAMGASETGATAARTRWHVSSAPSRTSRGHSLLGNPVWALDLVKNRSGPCGRITIGYSPAHDTFFPVATSTRSAFDKTSFDRTNSATCMSAPVVIPFTTALRHDEGDGR